MWLVGWLHFQTGVKGSWLRCYLGRQDEKKKKGQSNMTLLCENWSVVILLLGKCHILVLPGQSEESGV